MTQHEVQPAAADLLFTGPDKLNAMMGSFASSGGQHDASGPTGHPQHGGKKGRSKKQRAALKRHTRKVRQQYKKLMKLLRKKI